MNAGAEWPFVARPKLELGHVTWPAFAALQTAWLAQRRERFTAQRGRSTGSGPSRAIAAVRSNIFRSIWGLRYIGGQCRYRTRASTSVRLPQKHLLVLAASLALRRRQGRIPAPVKSGSGAVEKNLEVALNRRFKRQGRSWHPHRAERLLQLKRLAANPTAWSNWWKTKPTFTLNPNPP